jgi:hypothetical protein
VPIHRTRKRLLGRGSDLATGSDKHAAAFEILYRAYVPRSPPCLAGKGATHNTPARFERGCRRLVVDRSDCPTPRYCNLVAKAAERRPLSRTAGPALGASPLGIERHGSKSAVPRRRTGRSGSLPIRTVAVLWSPQFEENAALVESIRNAGKRLAIEVATIEIGGAARLPAAFDEAVRARAQAVIPTIHTYPPEVRDGGDVLLPRRTSEIEGNPMQRPFAST